MSFEPPPPIAYQSQALTEVDRAHLNVLAICYWVWGGLLALMSLFGIVYVLMGVAFLSGSFSTATSQNSAPPPATLGWVFLGLGTAIVVIGQLVGWLNVYAGFSLKRDRRYLLCVVVAGINCLSIPIGTVLGVFTFIVLSRPAVKAMFRLSAPIRAQR